MGEGRIKRGEGGPTDVETGRPESETLRKDFLYKRYFVVVVLLSSSRQPSSTLLPTPPVDYLYPKDSVRCFHDISI